MAAHKCEDFATLAKIEARIGVHNSPTKGTRCMDCPRVFDSHWELVRH